MTKTNTSPPQNLNEADSANLSAKKTSKDENPGSFAWFLFKLILVVLIFRTCIYTSFNIPSQSMMPRLLVGDYLMADKWAYGYSRYSLPLSPDLGDWRIFGSLPERGDVAIFKHPIDKTDYIKRVIGLPGDKIQITDGVLLINEEAVAKEKVEDFVLPIQPEDRCFSAVYVSRLEDGSFVCKYPQYRETLPNGVSYRVLDLAKVDVDDTAPIIVPQGKLLMMGDNRDNSQDSRKPAISGGWVGLIPEENLVGRASFIYFSTDGTAEWIKPWTWFSAARSERIGDGL